jgi:demethylmenaquinone methyltransferase/2-methoxy-6-polyprenyl-1,4-benzoquinol methylase
MPNNFLFDILAPFYDHVINPKDGEALAGPLDLPSPGWLLDAGGGTGRASAGLADKVDHIVICDLSFSMLRTAQEKGVKNLVQASVTSLPFAKETFNRIIVIDALHHMPEQKCTVGEMLRTLKSSGRMLIEEPDIHLFAVKIIALFEKMALMRSHFHTGEEIMNMIESYGAHASLGSDGKGSAWVTAKKTVGYLP